MGKKNSLLLETPRQRALRDAVRDGWEKKHPLELPYRLQFSPWDDIKFTAMGLFMLLFPLILLGIVIYVVWSLIQH